jgi:hypothetical protein
MNLLVREGYIRDSLRDLHNRFTDLEKFKSVTDAQQALNEMLEEMQPVLYGAKTAIRYSPRNSPPWLLEIFEQVVHSADKNGQLEVILQDARAKSIQGAKLDCFNWTLSDHIPNFFRSPLSPNEWPILGAFTLIYAFANKHHFHELPFFEKGDNLTFHSSQAWIKSASALGDILELPYWRRAWITQEIILARKPMLYYGPHIMPFGMFIQAQRYFWLHYEMCCAKWGKDAYRKDFTWWTKIRRGLSEIEKLSNLRDAHDSGEEKGHQSPLSLFTILRSGIARREASDPRDLVYGILGLVQSEGKEEIVADYHLSTAQVFANAAAKIIDDQQDLQLLTFNELGRDKKLGLRSWTPDWSSKGMFCPQPYEYRLFQASKDRPCIAQLQDDTCLLIQTVKVDTVYKIGPRRTLSWNPPRELVSLLKQWREIAGLRREAAKPGPSSRGDPHEEAFWQTLFADTIVNTEKSATKISRFQLEDVTKIMTWWTWLQAEAETFTGMEWNSLRSLAQPDGHHEITDMFWTSTEMRKFMITSSGHLGTGTARIDERYGFEVEVGDEIHVAFGCRVPLIMRPINVEGVHEEKPDSDGVSDKAPFYTPSGGCSHAQGNVYQLVGTCYIHGIMDGEALEDSTLETANIFLR